MFDHKLFQMENSLQRLIYVYKRSVTIFFTLWKRFYFLHDVEVSSDVLHYTTEIFRVIQCNIFEECTSAHAICRRGYANILDTFLRKDVPMNCINERKETPIELAYRCNRPVIVKLLIIAGYELVRHNVTSFF